MKKEKPLADKEYLLFKIGGKGGWAFAEISDIHIPKTAFGMFKSKGKIDGYEFSGYIDAYWKRAYWFGYIS